jgi:hypothetical protein
MLRAVALFALAALLVGCSAVGGGTPMTVFADPAKYQYSSCESIGRQRQSWTNREQELRQLMERADHSPGGGLVNVLAYKADYTAASEELQLLDAAARAKNCDGGANWQSNSAVR